MPVFAGFYSATDQNFAISMDPNVYYSVHKCMPREFFE